MIIQDEAPASGILTRYQIKIVCISFINQHSNQRQQDTKEVNEELNRYITKVGLKEQSFFELPAKNVIILRISSKITFT